MMAIFTCSKCGESFQMSWWKWMFITVFHWFSFKEMKDYRLTKCPYCKEKSFMKRW